MSELMSAVFCGAAAGSAWVSRTVTISSAAPEPLPAAPATRTTFGPFFLMEIFVFPCSNSKLVREFSDTALISSMISLISIAYSSTNFFTSRVALWPPNPRELEMAQFTSMATPCPLV